MDNNKELIEAIDGLKEAVEILTEAVDQNSGRQGELFDRYIHQGDLISTLNHRLESLEKTINKKL